MTRGQVVLGPVPWVAAFLWLTCVPTADAQGTQGVESRPAANEESDVGRRDPAIYRGLGSWSGRLLPAGAVVLEHGSPTAFGASLGILDHAQLGVGGSPPLNGLDPWYVKADAAVGGSHRALHGLLWTSLAFTGGRINHNSYASPEAGAAGMACLSAACNWSLSGSASVGRYRGGVIALRVSNLWRISWDPESPFSLLAGPTLWARLDRRQPVALRAAAGFRFADRLGAIDVVLLRVEGGALGPFLTLALRLD